MSGENKSWGGFAFNSAAGHQAIINEFNKGQRTHYFNETLWNHYCESNIGALSDTSWFAQVDTQCTDTVLYKHAPKGITISSMTAYNQKLKSTTPTQTTMTMQFGEWLYSQWKWSRMEMYEKCDVESYLADVEKQFRLQLDEYIEKQILMRMACVNPCWNDSCRSDFGLSGGKIYKVTTENSHKIPLLMDSLKKTICDDRGFFLTWPRCKQLVLSSNEEVKRLYTGCCTANAPSITGETPKFGSNTTIVYSDHVPYRLLPDNRKAYALTHAPIGSFGYASMLAVSETVDSNSIEDHWSKIMRMIMRYGMIIPAQWDYTTIWAVIDDVTLELEYV